MKFIHYLIKWLLGILMNSVMILVIYFIMKTWQGWSLQLSVLVSSLIQMVLIVPNYVKEVKIMPQGAPAQLRGMNENDYNGNPDYMGIKRFPFDHEIDEQVTGMKWFFLRRSVMQQLSYFILMMGLGIFLKG